MTDQGKLSALAGPPMSVRRRGINRALLHLPLASRRRAQYLLAQDRWLRLRNPRTWTEKINWRMVHDRRELVAMTCDKLAAKDWVERTTTPDLVALPRTVWAGEDAAGLADVDWPEHWVVKPNHGTGLVQLGRGRPDAARLAELVALADRWLTAPGPELWGEWGYGRARRMVLVEEAIPNTPLTGRTDYKFYVVGGEPRLVYVDSGRFGDHVGRHLAPDGTPVDDSVPEATPAGWDALLTVAGKLGAGFDAIRVDLYLEDGRPWFGELTAYDGSGLLLFPSRAIDRELGAAWDLPVGIGRRRGHARHRHPHPEVRGS